jgi:hypothetical protein
MNTKRSWLLGEPVFNSAFRRAILLQVTSSDVGRTADEASRSRIQKERILRVLWFFDCYNIMVWGFRVFGFREHRGHQPEQFQEVGVTAS